MKNNTNTQRQLAMKSLVLAMAGAGLLSLPQHVLANPTGGQVVAGNVTIRQESATKVGITQTTDKGIIDWQKFSIGANEHVQFYQPSASSVTLNRVVGQDPSQILGRLTANGQIFLVNPNGIFFGKNAQIDVAGLVASTHNIRNEDFLAGKYNFNIPGKPGAAVINEGNIRIADTGIAAFVAPSVANRGVIVARLGKVALAAANGFTLDFHGDQLLSFLVSDDVAKTAFDLEGQQLTSFVENSGRIEAQGGYVLLTAKAAESAIHGVINHSGVIEATTVGTQKGEIILHAGKGSLEVSGTLGASAPNGGDGGFIDTSGAQVSIAANTRVNTGALSGKNGLWLIDPLDITINGSMAQAIISALSNGDVTVTTSGNNTPSTAAGEVNGNGDIFVNGAIGWSANKFSLFAHRNIYFNNSLSGSGTAKLALQYGQGSANGSGSDYFLRNGAKINLPAGENFSTKQGVNGTVKNYTVITSLGGEGSRTGTDLQGMNGNISKNYAIGSDIDASNTATWNNGQGFDPISDTRTGFNPFHGSFDGLGHTISHLFINRTRSSIGLFARAVNGVVQNIGLIEANITGATGSSVGILAGSAQDEIIKDSFVTGRVEGRIAIGGLVGQTESSSVANSHSTAQVIGSGLIGTVKYVGGLIGFSSRTDVSTSFAKGGVAGVESVGGLIGFFTNSGNVHNSLATGSVSGNTRVGGLVGSQGTGDIRNSYAVGNVSGQSYVGGLVGQVSSDGGKIITSYANGGVNGGNNVGGLIGSSYRIGYVQNSYYDTETTGQTDKFSSYGTGKTTAQMQQQATFTGWDFVNTWRILEGGSYPLLRGLTQGTIVVKPNQLGIRANNVTKIYDGVAVTKVTESVNDHIANDLASLAGWNGGVTTSGLLGSDLITDASIFSGTLTYGGTWQGAKNAGTYSIIPGGLSSQKYEIVYAPGQMTIQPRPVDVAVSKTYNGNGIFTSGFSVTNGVVAGDATPNISGSATVASGDAGTYTRFSTNALVSSDSNYTANPQYVYSGELGKVTAQINPAALNLIGVTGRREYDGTTNAYWSDDLYLFGPMVASDRGNVKVISGSGVLGGINVGRQPLISTGSFQLGGNGAENYRLSTEGSYWNIVPRNISVSVSKTYDGSPVFTNGFIATDGVINGDIVRISGVANVSSPNVGGYTEFSSHNLVLDNSNYAIVNSGSKQGGILATIKPAITTISGRRMYDGSADVESFYIHLGGVLPLDNIKIYLFGKGVLSGKDVGVQSVHSLGTLELDGDAAKNYQLTTNGSAFHISPRPVSVSGSREYDGTKNANWNDKVILSKDGNTYYGVLAPDYGNVWLSSGVGVLSGKAPGKHSLISLGTLTLGGSASQNYVLDDGGDWSILPAVSVTTPRKTVPVGFDGNSIGYITNITGTFSIYRTDGNKWEGLGSTAERVPVMFGDIIDARGGSLQITFVDGSKFLLSTELVDLLPLQSDEGFAIETTIAESVLQSKSVWGQVKTSTGGTNTSYGLVVGVRG